MPSRSNLSDFRRAPSSRAEVTSLNPTRSGSGEPRPTSAMRIRHRAHHLQKDQGPAASAFEHREQAPKVQLESLILAQNER